MTNFQKRSIRVDAMADEDMEGETDGSKGGGGIDAPSAINAPGRIGTGAPKEDPNGKIKAGSPLPPTGPVQVPHDPNAGKLTGGNQPEEIDKTEDESSETDLEPLEVTDPLNPAGAPTLAARGAPQTPGAQGAENTKAKGTGPGRVAPKADSNVTLGCQRWDRGELAAPVRMDNGWLRVDARLTRTGIFSYRNQDGSERRELRLPEEVFSKDAIDSFHLVPVTNDHPAVGFLDSTNAKIFAVGAVEKPHKDAGRYVSAQMLIHDGATVAAMERGKQEVSCGYLCDLEDSSGEYEGARYDCVQRNIRGNHVAIVSTGRAGPEVRVRMDSKGAVQVDSSKVSEVPKGKEMRKIKINGVWMEVANDVADAFEAQAGNARARIELEKKLVGVLDGVKLDSLSDREVRIAALAKLAPSRTFATQSDDYVAATLDAVLDAQGSVALNAARSAMGVIPEAHADSMHLDDRDPRVTPQNARYDVATAVAHNKKHFDAVLKDTTAREDKFYTDSRNAWTLPLQSTRSGFGHVQKGN